MGSDVEDFNTQPILIRAKIPEWGTVHEVVARTELVGRGFERTLVSSRGGCGLCCFLVQVLAAGKFSAEPELERMPRVSVMLSWLRCFNMPFCCAQDDLTGQAHGAMCHCSSTWQQPCCLCKTPGLHKTGLVAGSGRDRSLSIKHCACAAGAAHRPPHGGVQ